MRSNPDRPKGNPIAVKGRAFHLPTAAEKAIIDKKVNEVAKLLAKGVSQKQIKSQKSEEWQCTEQNVNYYIKKAIKSIHTGIEKRIENVLAIQQERLELVLNSAIEKGDYSKAQKVIDTMNKMYGLYTERKEVKIDAPTIKFDFGKINKEEKDEINE